MATNFLQPFASVLLVIIVGFALESRAQLVEIPGTVGNKMFFIGGRGGNWIGAHYVCQSSNNTELAAIESHEETVFLQAYFQGLLGNSTVGPYFWTSGSTLGTASPDRAELLKWSTTGADIGYRNWQNRQEPAMGTPFDFHKCIAASYNRGTGATVILDFNWNIKDCNTVYECLCQKFF